MPLPTSCSGGGTTTSSSRGAKLLFPSFLSRILRRSCAHPSQLAQIHAHMIKTGLDLLPFPVAKLLAAAALVDPAYARAVFARIASPNLFHYNALLRGFSVAPSPTVDEALPLFGSLRARRVPLDQFTFVSVLKASARSSALQEGRQIHCVVAKIGFENYVNVRNALMHLYACCRKIHDARLLFDEVPLLRDAVSFGTMMNGYLQASHPEKVVSLFREMLRACGPQATNAAGSIVSTLSAAASLVDACCGVEPLHGYCVKSGFDSDLKVSTAFVFCYARTGRMDSARMVFDSMTEKDLVLYNCMVHGYAKGGTIDEALGCVKKMRDKEGPKPNASTYAGLLAACAASGAVGIGRRIHECINREFLEFDAILGTALVDMYSKSGCIYEAMGVFERMSSLDVKAWTAMIMGLGVHGQAEAAVQLFNEMEDKGAKPNEVTFLAVLTACSHGGLVSSAKECFQRMVQTYGLSPKMEHYGCLIDLLGRAGLLEEAHDFVKSLPSPLEGDATAWRALLAACRLHGNIQLAESAQKALVSLGDRHPSDTILLAATYTIAGRSMSGEQVENKVMTTKKEAGFSAVEMDG